MPQFVIEFGAEHLECIASAIKDTVPEPFSISIDSTESEMSYSATGKTLDDVATDLATGSVASVIIRTRSSDQIRAHHKSKYARSAACPMGGDHRGKRRGVAVRLGRAPSTTRPEICSVADEEGLVVADQQISPETFPWDVDRLLAAAIRDDAQSEWTQRARR